MGRWGHAPDSTGRGNGTAQDLRLRCTGCAFKGELSTALDHHVATGHALAYRGTVQNFDRLLRERAQATAKSNA